MIAIIRIKANQRFSLIRIINKLEKNKK